tara:strand:- start:2775 stop:3932 length:1158 start_codon:yes stop_codon:yes gene_type:complete
MKILFISIIFSIGFCDSAVVAAISKIKGDVKIRPGDDRKYVSAYKGQMVKNGDWIKTDYGVFLGIIFLDGSKIKIHENTEIEIKSSRITAKELRTKMFLAEGETYGDIANQGRGQFEIETPTAVASVKGTELDVNFDFNEEVTTLTVVEGLVEFGNDLGTITAGAMEAAQVSEDEEVEVYQITESDLPTWQDEEVEPSWGFILSPEKVGSQPINEPYKVNIQVINPENNENQNSFEGQVNISSNNELLKISVDEQQWGNSININVTNGVSYIYVKGINSGSYSIIASGDDFESKILSSDFYQSENQKSELQSKFESVIQSKGYQTISELISDKSLKSTSIISGSIDADAILQKINIGEFQLVDLQEIQNSDGTISIKLKAKPISD